MAERRFHSASAPFDQDGKIYHLGAGLGDVAATVVLVEDPAHLAAVTTGWDEARQIANVRAYTLYGGLLGGQPITAGCTSSDSHGASTVVESLARLGARTLIRVGACTSLQPDLLIGQAVIATGAVRLDAVGRGYVRSEYPAGASIEVLIALLEAAAAAGLPSRYGIVASTDSWYAGQGFAGYGGYQSPTTRTLIPDLRTAHVLSVDQVTSALLTVASVYGLRAGSICVVQSEQDSGRFIEPEIDAVAGAANCAVRLLALMDEQRDAAGARMWYPGLVGRPREETRDGS